MDVTRLMSVGMLLTVALSGCAFEQMEAVWPEPRPLGRDLPAYRAPAEPSLAARPPVEELKGALSLERVLRAALLRNPELSSTALERKERDREEAVQSG